MTQNVIVVGAPRSGTNMLRDVLTSVPGVTTWPCDEINLLWKHGNVDVPHDEIPLDRARPEVVTYLRRAFDARARADHAHTVIEKTCATSLRVPFTRAVFPEARYIFIYRDGLDAAASAVARWNAPFDLRYTLRKARFVPASDLPRHLIPFAQRRLGRLGSGGAAAQGGQAVGSWWGPKPHDFREVMAQHPLEEAAFIQWQRCVEAAESGLAGLPAEQLLTVRYEDYVTDARAQTERILDFLGAAHLLDQAAISGVSPDSVGKGRRQLGPEAVERLEALGHQTLARFGYV